MIELRFDGLQELINKLERAGKLDEIASTQEKLIMSGTEEAKKQIKSHFPRSGDNSKSGKKGYRPSGHFVDNIPQTNIKQNSKGMYLTLGAKTEKDPYFYSKFPNFGTSKQPPNFAFQYAYESAQKLLDEQGVKEFEALIERIVN